MAIFKKIWLSCQQATMLISKKQHTGLTVKEAAQLRLHLAICKFCNRFQQQTNLIGRLAKKIQQQQPAVLSEQKKQALQKQLRDAQ
ncbi:MAG: hypothetical protein RL172_1220 [Bacteroidota bacterium]|jgi:hypothetical protein